MMQAVERKAITNKAMELVRVRFRPYGREPFAAKRIAGVDCVGAVIWVGEQLNLVKDVQLPPYAFPPQREIWDTFEKYCTRINEPQEGSIVILGTREGAPAHCGFLTRSADGWNVIGLSSVIRRPYITMYSLKDSGLTPWRYYDFKNVA